VTVAILGIGLAKRVFHLHGVDGHGRAVVSERVSRARLAEAVVHPAGAEGADDGGLLRRPLPRPPLPRPRGDRPPAPAIVPDPAPAPSMTVAPRCHAPLAPRA
jgi:hypothetical protein